MASVPVIIDHTTNADLYRASTDAAGLCREIVLKTASNIQGRRFVSVEGWQAIAIAHGCAAASRNVEKIDDGVRAIGEVRRMSDGALIATAEGFVGEDEPTWYGGQSRGKTLPKRADYAIRAMAQTRAISRACRSAFAHVVVMMDAGLSTTPAEEVPEGGFADGGMVEAKRPEWPEGPTANKTAAMAVWRAVKAKLTDGIDVEAFERDITANGALIAQFRIAEHAWWRGVTSDGEVFESIPDWIARRRAEIAAPADDGMVAAALVDMRKCKSQHELTAWQLRNSDMLDALADAERREFERQHDAFAAGLQQVEVMAA